MMTMGSDGTAVRREVEGLAGAVRGAARVVVLTGAGMSTESGVPDFRGPAGLWQGADPASVAHVDVLRDDPARLWRFYRHRLATLRDARPNPGHDALARLERAGRLHRLITQNTDGLHAAAGSRPVEVHGSLREASCSACGAVVPMEEAERCLDAAADGVPRCRCGGTLRPAVVLFGEALPAHALEGAMREAESCDLLLALGTSLAVWPVAEMPLRARRAGARVAIVNRGPTEHDDVAEIRIDAALGTVLPAVAVAVLGVAAGAGG